MNFIKKEVNTYINFSSANLQIAYRKTNFQVISLSFRNEICQILIIENSNSELMIPQVSQIFNPSIIRELGGQRVAQEQIILQNQQTLSTIRSVLCPLCNCVLKMPHWSCDKCESLCCKDCMQDWWAKDPRQCIMKCQDPQFNLVKRSNTYQAVMQILKVRCKNCEAAVSISAIASHDKICPKKLMECAIQGCRQLIIRCELQDHLKNCTFRKQKCRYCGALLLASAIQNHGLKQCPQRVVSCQNIGCEVILKSKQLDLHSKTCQYLEVNCQWCKTAHFKGNIQLHSSCCPQRQVYCQWCKHIFKMIQYNQHNQKCEERTKKCSLCDQSIKQADQKQHQQECMFTQLLKFKKMQSQLIHQNTKMKQKIHQLELTLDQMTRNRHQDALKSLIQLKQEERKELEWDLVRIKNSLHSIRKMRNEELVEHQKKLHLSTSLCVSKMEEQMSPLIKIYENTVHKIKDLERTQNTAKKSIIRQAGKG